MFKFIIIAIVIGGFLLIVKNLFDRSIAQYLKNQDNNNQREHEQNMEELKMNNRKYKHAIGRDKIKGDLLK